MITPVKKKIDNSMLYSLLCFYFSFFVSRFRLSLFRIH